MVDHSLTYKKKSLRNLPHFLRLKKIQSTIEKLLPQHPFDYFDVGCSNGFITSIVSSRIQPAVTYGFEYNDENLKVARKSYPEINFQMLNLNHITNTGLKADLVTCFETLEHVGNIKNAVENISQLCKEQGTVLVTVPIEIGAIGTLKFLIKTLIYRYSLSEFSVKEVTWLNYLLAIFSNRIADFRIQSPKDHWGTHFGFDYHEVEIYMRKSFRNVHSYSSFTTRIIIASEPILYFE
jgi:2-polyprenyl-3-methyl-5-hydroxy-6-metoxy-1,4-benzoquinol methylase